MARPKSANPRVFVLHIRLTENEWLKAKASAGGMTVGEWARGLLFKSVGLGAAKEQSQKSSSSALECPGGSGVLDTEGRPSRDEASPAQIMDTDDDQLVAPIQFAGEHRIDTHDRIDRWEREERRKRPKLSEEIIRLAKAARQKAK